MEVVFNYCQIEIDFQIKTTQSAILACSSFSWALNYIQISSWVIATTFHRTMPPGLEMWNFQRYNTSNLKPNTETITAKQAFNCQQTEPLEKSMQYLQTQTWWIVTHMTKHKQRICFCLLSLGMDTALVRSSIQILNLVSWKF